MNPFDSATDSLQPLPYHRAISSLLQADDPKVWNWFHQQRAGEAYAKRARLDLLKSCYRLHSGAEPALYDAANSAARKLGVECPITLYRSQNSRGTTAATAFIPGEAHVVLHGPLEENLTSDELVAVMAHELSHQILMQNWDGQFHSVDQILAACTLDEEAGAACYESDRLFSLYTEVFCDRGALLAVDDPHIVVSTLVKVETGSKQAAAESYLTQATEVLDTFTHGSESTTHPELFIRAKAVQLWHDQEPSLDEQLKQWIEGRLNLARLDLVAQHELANDTRELVGWMLENQSIRKSDSISATVQSYFPGLQNQGDPQKRTKLLKTIAVADKNVKEYFCFVLLDLVTVDRDLEEVPLAAALMIAESMGIKNEMLEIVHRELKLRKGQLKKIDKEKDRLLES